MLTPTTPDRANPFGPLAEELDGPEPEPGVDRVNGGSGPGAAKATRPRANSAPATPSHSITDSPSRAPPAPTPAQAQQNTQATALLAQSPVRTRHVPPGAAAAARRNVTFNLIAGTDKSVGVPVRNKSANGRVPQGRGRRRTRSPTAVPDTRNKQPTPGPILSAAQETTPDAVTLYETAQDIAFGIDRIIDDLMRTSFPDEASYLGSLLSDAVRAFARPPSQASQRTPSIASRPRSQTSQHTPSTASRPPGETSQRSSSYASIAAGSVPLPATTSRAPSSAPSSSPLSPRSSHGQSARRLSGNKGSTRVFLRLPPDHPLREADPVTVRTRANAVPETRDLFKTAYPVPTGFALVTDNATELTAEIASRSALEEAFNATAFEPQELWVTYFLSPVPRRIRDLDGLAHVSPGLVTDEVTLVTGLTPRRTHWTKRSASSPHEAEGEMVLHFVQDPSPLPARFWLFGRQAGLRLIRKSHSSVRPCKSCHQYHNANASVCRRPPRCVNCGQARHESPEPCTLPARCINCRGPHEATDSSCPARP